MSLPIFTKINHFWNLPGDICTVCSFSRRIRICSPLCSTSKFKSIFDDFSFSLCHIWPRKTAFIISSARRKKSNLVDFRNLNKRLKTNWMAENFECTVCNFSRRIRICGPFYSTSHFWSISDHFSFFFGHISLGESRRQNLKSDSASATSKTPISTPTSKKIFWKKLEKMSLPIFTKIDHFWEFTRRHMHSM